MFYFAQVLDLPDSKPVLKYNRDSQAVSIHDGRGKAAFSYKVGDILDVNCTSPRSKPPATLKWYINNERVRQICTK